MRIRQAFATGLLALTPALTGCLTHTHSVLKTRLPTIVLSTSLDHLLQMVDDRYNATQSATLFVDISASSGGSRQGKVTDTAFSFSSYIILQNPDHIRVILTIPLYGKGLDMVSDGKSFKMLIHPRSCAITGSDTAPPPPPPGAGESLSQRLYRLRPAVILDSLLIRGLQPDQIVSMTQDSRPPIPATKTKTQIIEGKALRKDLVEDPDYDLEFLSQPKGQAAQALRVVHIDRTNLLPWRQDIYNADGKIETQAFYDNYQKFGDINFPTKIVIQRPLDELGLTITVTRKTTFNQKFDPDQFVPDPIPPSYVVQNMDDPASAATNACAAHPESPAATASPGTAKH